MKLPISQPCALRGLRLPMTLSWRRLRRCGAPWWHNRMLQDYGLALGLALAFASLGGTAVVIFFVGQAVLRCTASRSSRMCTTMGL